MIPLHQMRSQFYQNLYPVKSLLAIARRPLLQIQSSDCSGPAAPFVAPSTIRPPLVVTSSLWIPLLASRDLTAATDQVTNAATLLSKLILSGKPKWFRNLNMSNGGKVESRQDGGNALDNRASSHEFGSAISRIAVAQICESVGFESSTESAMNSFSDVIAKYISDLGKTATSYASLSGRSQCNVFDVIHGLEDFCPHTGFMGASEANVCGVNSGVMKEIVEYVEASEEIPFAQPVSRFPVIKIPKMIPTFDQIGENPESKHIPSWLPAFPDPHTYIHTDTWNERVSDPRDDKIELARQRRKAERSLLNLQQRLVCNGLPMPSSSHKLEQFPGSKLTLNDEESENPFLAKTLQAGDKDASSIALPAKLSANEHHTSLLQTFSPAIEAIKDGISEMGNGTEKKNVTYKRLPALCLEFKPGKKVLGDSLDVRLWNNGGSRRGASWFRKDDDNKDDKKRRAELILRQSIENQQELMQL